MFRCRIWIAGAWILGQGSCSLRGCCRRGEGRDPQVPRGRPVKPKRQQIGCSLARWQPWWKCVPEAQRFWGRPHRWWSCELPRSFGEKPCVGSTSGPRRAASKGFWQLGTVASHWSTRTSKSAGEHWQWWCLSMSFWFAKSKWSRGEATSDSVAVLKSTMGWW